MKFIGVVIENNSRHTDMLYTYKASDDVKIGAVVEVPFSRGNKPRRGFVISEIEKPEYDEGKIKEIISVNQKLSLSEEMVETSLWMKQRYGIKYLDALKCFIPPGKPAKEGKEKRPLKETKSEEQNIESLTDEQREAVDKISSAIETQKQKSFLLHGITGSGKTEVYMQAIEKTLTLGRTVIMLVPEIALTKQITERFIGRFGKESIAILHSRLTPRARFDEWMRIRHGDAKIVIGARMGVFAPLENIGLIIMDEEHESTYKADMNPKYETVDIAMKRAITEKAVLILGSATPSVVTYQRTKDGIFDLLQLKKRYNGVELPDITVVDMKEELKKGNRSMFSERMVNEMERAFSNNEQVIIFLNRRGYSNVVTCTECGNTLTCKTCGIRLTYHKSENAAVCHYCGQKQSVSKPCDNCGSKMFRYIGVGTEQVEEKIAELFPNRSISRLDFDTAKNNREISRIINDFAEGKTDILVGTQLVAKGLDFKNVGVVIVVSADGSLNIPDYRSSERTFQLITQVAGRAGRGDKKGVVIVQTYSPDNFAITTASSYDYEGFFNQEIKFRELMKYPPFTDLILVEFTHESEDISEKEAAEFKKYIETISGVMNDEVFEPRVSSYFKGQDGKAFRYYTLIKSKKGNRNRYLKKISDYIDMKLLKGASQITVDVNPYSMI